MRCGAAAIYTTVEVHRLNHDATAGVVASMESPARLFTQAVGAGAVGLVGLPGFLMNAPYQFWLLTALAVASEIVPFVASRFQRLLLPIFISVCFAFGVLLLWGLGPALVAQTLAVLGAWLRLRLNIVRIVSICTRLDISLVVASVVFDAIADRHFAPGDGVAGTDVFAVVAAVAGWFAANYLLLTLEAWLRQGAHWQQALRPILPYDVISNAALLMLGPSLVSGPGWVIVLLLVPLVAIGQMARLSGDRDRQARVDPVTGLLSRRAFLSDVEGIRVDRRGQVRDSFPAYAVFLLDLDRFKHVNDAFGHDVGDRLLAEVGRRLASAVRPGDFVARIGGDEFVVLAVGIRDRGGAAAVADRINHVLAEPIVLRGLPIDVGYSVGAALYPEDGDDLATVMRHADNAMYTAKHRGGGLAFYSGETQRKPKEGISMLADLRRTLDDPRPGDLALRFAPEVSIGGGVVGVEALLDWRSSRHGRVDPDELIRAAEHTPVMRRLTVWTVNETLDRLVVWQDSGRRIRTSIKLSARDLETTEVADLLADRLHRDAVSPELVALEISENALMAEPDLYQNALTVLADAAIAVCLDGFGTGHASIRDLRRLPVGELKIDRSLIRRMTSDPDSEAVVRAIVDMGRALELRVVAAGVENEATHHRLAALHCPIGQGSFYAEAMTADAFEEWLDTTGPAN